MMITSRMTPTTINGRRRPNRLVFLSESIPIKAWMSKAAISAHNRRFPSAVPLLASPTNCWIKSGITSGVKTCDLEVIANQLILIVMKLCQRICFSTVCPFYHFFNSGGWVSMILLLVLWEIYVLFGINLMRILLLVAQDAKSWTCWIPFRILLPSSCP